MLLCKLIGNFLNVKAGFSPFGRPKWKQVRKDHRFHSTQRLEEAYKKIKAKCQCKYQSHPFN